MSVPFDSGEPIYLQITKLFKRDMARGELSPGQKVTPVRELALSLGVNPNTVQRALADLERDGLLYSERTAGRYVTADAGLIQALRQDIARNAAADYVNILRTLNYTRADILTLTREALGAGGMDKGAPGEEEKKS